MLALALLVRASSKAGNTSIARATPQLEYFAIDYLKYCSPLTVIARAPMNAEENGCPANSLQGQ